MNRLIIILAITAAAILGSIYLLRSSTPARATSTLYSPLDHSSQTTPNSVHSSPPAVPASSPTNRATELTQAFQLPEEDAWKTIPAIVEEWGASDPNSVFSALLRAPENELRHNALVQLAAIWAETNPQLAAETFKSQTSGDEQERGVAQAVSTWAKIDPMAALNWVNQNSGSAESRNPLRERFYAAWASVEPEAAARFALANATIASELDAVLASWAHSDLAAAVQFQKTEVPADKQTRSRPALLLAAASQNSPLSETLLNEFLATNPTREEAFRIAKALSSLQPKLAQAIADALPQGPDTQALRDRIAALGTPVSKQP